MFFLVSEVVWDKVKYPDPTKEQLLQLSKEALIKVEDAELIWLKEMYGNIDENAPFLRIFLRQFKLL